MAAIMRRLFAEMFGKKASDLPTGLLEHPG
jgi:hypothetical protein